MRLEHRHEPLVPPRVFLRRVFLYGGAAIGLIAFSLGVGVLGYHVIAGLNWIDSLLNASMILTGMGPVDPMRTFGAKLFASCYAIYSGVAFLTSVGVFLTPVAHRILHHLHLEADEDDREGRRRR
jgi:hypothetical protein